MTYTNFRCFIRKWIPYIGVFLCGKVDLFIIIRNRTLSFLCERCIVRLYITVFVTVKNSPLYRKTFTLCLFFFGEYYINLINMKFSWPLVQMIPYCEGVSLYYTNKTQCGIPGIYWRPPPPSCISYFRENYS